MVDWKFCSSSIFEIDLTLLSYEILEKLVTFIYFIEQKSIKENQEYTNGDYYSIE